MSLHLVPIRMQGAVFSHSTHYNTKNGMTGNTVTSISQDSRGFIWIANKNGVERFDGNFFKQYDLNERTNTIYHDEDDLMWIGTDNGVYTYDNSTDIMAHFKTETRWQVPVSSKTTVITGLGNGKILIGTYGQGIFIYDKKNGELNQYSLHASMIVQACKIPNGNILVAAEEGLIIEISPDGKLVRTIYDETDGPNRNTTVSALYNQGNHIFAELGNKDFCMINSVTSGLARIPGAHSCPAVQTIIPQSTGKSLFLGTRKGLYCLDKMTVREATDASGRPLLPNENINTLLIDKEGGLWIGTENNGIYYLSASTKIFFEYLSADQDSRGESIKAFCSDSDDNIWFGSDKAVYCQNPGTSQPATKKFDIGHDITCMMWDNDKLWIGTATEGIYIWNKGGNLVKNLRHDRYVPESLSDNSVNCLFKDSNGRIYVGTKWGLNYYNRRSEDFSHELRSSNKANVSTIFEDSRKNIWIGTHNNSLLRMSLSRKDWRRFNLPQAKDSDKAYDIHAVAEDNSGQIWFATSMGMLGYNYEDDKVLTKDFNSSFKTGELISILQDNKGNIWAAGTSGIYCFNLKNNSVDNIYGSEDGFPENTFFEASSAKDRNGNLYFGGINGYIMFSPDSFSDNLCKSRLYITDIQINNNTISDVLSCPSYLTSRLILQNKQNSITFRTALLSFQAPNKNRYSYILEGHDNNWSSYTNVPVVSYTNLKAGKYRFRVKALNNDGIENSNGDISIDIVIKRPKYASIGAILIYLVVLSVLFYVFYRQYKNRKNRKNIEDKIDFLTNMTHEIRTPITLIKTPLDKIIKSGDGSNQTRSYLSMIDRNVESLMELVDQSLDYRKTSDINFRLNKTSCDVEGLVRDIIFKFKLLAESQGIEIIYSQAAPAYYHIDITAINKIVSNLLSNAVKYAARQVNVNLETLPEIFTISVYNDGPSIKKEEQKKIFKMFYQSNGSKAGTGIGLALAKMLAEKHHGTVEVIPTEEGAGFRMSIAARSCEAPAVKKDAEVIPVESSSGQAKENEQDRYTILVVDDNLDLRLLIAEILKENYTIYQAGNGKQALAMLEKIAIDLIISDVLMDEMDGIELCQAVKSDIRFSNIPVILLTAKSNIDDKVKGLDSGADDYIIKPFAPEYLTAKLTTLLDNRQRLMKFYQELPAVHPTKISTISKESLEFIEKLNSELTRNLSNSQFYIENIADQMFLSQSSFYRKVKSTLGMSPNEYIKHFRLQKAAEMLSHGEYSINEVCNQCGFNTISYFSSCFKKKFGMSPTQYLSSMKEKAENLKQKE